MFQKRKEHGLCDKQVSSISSLDLQQTKLSSKLHLKCQYPSPLWLFYFLSFFFFNFWCIFNHDWKISHYNSFSHPNHPNFSLWNSLTEKDESVLMTMRFCIVIVLCMCYVYEVFTQQCKEDEHAISGMMLRGHTFRTMRSSIAFECHQAYYNDFRCHSFNYVISKELYELNNRTKEARPENFVPNSERYYVRSNKKRGEIQQKAALALALIEVIWTW